MCKVTSQALRGHKANNWPVKVFRKPQSMISEGHEKFSANRTCSGVCRVPCLQYLCKIKVEDDYKRMKSEVEIRNGNGKIDKSECKTSTVGAACVAACPYSCIYAYMYIQLYILSVKGWVYRQLGINERHLPSGVCLFRCRVWGGRLHKKSIPLSRSSSDGKSVLSCV